MPNVSRKTIRYRPAKEKLDGVPDHKWPEDKVRLQGMFVDRASRLGTEPYSNLFARLGWQTTKMVWKLWKVTRWSSILNSAIVATTSSCHCKFVSSRGWPWIARQPEKECISNCWGRGKERDCKSGKSSSAQRTYSLWAKRIKCLRSSGRGSIKNWDVGLNGLLKRHVEISFVHHKR